jgi:hypothetical protein
MTAFTTQRVLRLRLYVEEYNPTFHYIRGENNSIADALSRVPRSTSLSVGKSMEMTQKELKLATEGANLQLQVVLDQETGHGQEGRLPDSRDYQCL